MHQVVKVKVPACIGNFAVGFDILGAAVDIISEELIVRHNPDLEGVHITKIIGDNKQLSKNPINNTAGVAAISLLKHLGLEHLGIEIELYKKIGIGTGLASSAASAAGVVVAINKLLKQPLELRELLHFATLGEMIASGQYNTDNTAPCLLGSIQIMTALEPLTVQRISVPDGLYLAIVYPKIQILSSASRSALSDTVTLEQHIQQSMYLSNFIMGLERSNIPLIRSALKDIIIEPQRSKSIPYFDMMQKAALDLDALGCSISGSGPTVFALCHNSLIAQNCAQAMTQVLQKHHIEYQSWVTTIRKQGVEIY